MERRKFEVTFYDAGNCDLFSVVVEEFWMDAAIDVAQTRFHHVAMADAKVKASYEAIAKAVVEVVQ